MAKVESRSNNLGSPEWCADFLSRDHLMPYPAKVLASAFEDGNGIVVQSNGGAAQGATSLPVDAISGPIPNGTVLDFGGAKFARLTAAAATGATSLTVTALVTAIADNDRAIYSKHGTKYLPSGTLIGRTRAERDSNTPFGPAVNTDDEVFLTAFDSQDLMEENDVELVRPGTVIKENYLPGWTTISANADLLAKLRAVYECIKGVN